MTVKQDVLERRKIIKKNKNDILIYDEFYIKLFLL